MLEFAAGVESTPISKALFGMSWLWPACESLHFIGLCMLIGGAGLLDLRLMGMFRVSSARIWLGAPRLRPDPAEVR